MKNHQIGRKTKTELRAEQQRRDVILRKLAFIEAHGTENEIRKVSLVVNLVSRVVRSPSRLRSAFRAFAMAAKARRPFMEIFAELTKLEPNFVKDRAALQVISGMYARRTTQ